MKFLDRLLKLLFGQTELQQQRRRLRDQCARIAEVELRNANARAASRLEQLQSRGVPYADLPERSTATTTGAPRPGTYWEQDPLFGWPTDPLADNWGSDAFGMGWPMSAFPRELWPERPTTLRTQIAQDWIRLLSRAWFETMPFYSGPIGHLRNYVCGSGMTFDCVPVKKHCDKKSTRHEQAETSQASADGREDKAANNGGEGQEKSNPDEELACEIQDYLDGWAKFRHNNLRRRVRDSVVNLFRDGEDALRVSPPPRPLPGEAETYPEVRNVDTSTIRGPHNEITGPWAYGVLTDWPDDYEAVKAYHLWKANNTHEDVLPTVLKLAKLDTTGPNVKRGVPLAYKIRRQLPQMAKLLDCMAVGEAARQAIPYIRQFNTADKAAIRSMSPSYLDSLEVADAEYNAALGFGTDPTLRRYDEIRAGEVPLINKGQQFVDTPQGRAESGTMAYRTLAETLACALNVPLWFITGTADQENYASSLVSESPLVRTVGNVQEIVTAHYTAVCEAVIEIAAALGKFPVDWKDRVQIHCELPSPIARDPDKAVDSDIKLLDKKLLSPQHLCVRNQLDFDEEQELIGQAEEGGWQAQTEMELALAGQADDTQGGNGPPKGPEPSK